MSLRALGECHGLLRMIRRFLGMDPHALFAKSRDCRTDCAVVFSASVDEGLACKLLGKGAGYVEPFFGFSSGFPMVGRSAAFGGVTEGICAGSGGSSLSFGRKQ